MTACLDGRPRMPMCLGGGARGDSALCLGLPVRLSADAHLDRGRSGGRAACLLLTGRNAVRVARRSYRSRQGSKRQGHRYRSGDS